MAFVEFVRKEKSEGTGQRSSFDKATLKVKRRATMLGFSAKWCEENKIDFTKGVSLYFDPASHTVKLVANSEASWKGKKNSTGRQSVSIGRMLRQHGLEASASVFNLEIALNPKDKSVLISLEDHLGKKKSVKSSKPRSAERAA